MASEILKKSRSSISQRTGEIESVPSHLAPTLTDFSDLGGLSLYEKKCTLVNREIEREGIGKYQWCVWILCGFGFFLDLLWAQAFGLVLSPLKQEFGFSDGQSGNISASAHQNRLTFLIGLTLSGRRWAFNLTCIFSSVFGLCLGASNSYSTFIILTAFVGFGVGGNVPVDSAIFLEFVPQNRRFLIACLSLFQPLGVVVCSAIAFGFIPTYSCSPNFSESGALPSCKNAAPGVDCCSKSNNMGWRYLLFTVGAISLAILILRVFVFTLHETPKYLIYKNQDNRAVDVMQKIAHANNKPCHITVETFAELEQQHKLEESRSCSQLAFDPRKNTARTGFIGHTTTEFQRIKLLFDGFEMTQLTILVWLTYIMDFWGFTVAGFYLPRILAIKNGAASVSLRATYASYIYTYAPGMAGVLLGALSYRIPRIGRKWAMVLSSGLMGASLLLFSVVDTVAKNEGLFAMEYFFQSMFNAVLYGWTPEAFPAPIRGTASGVASFWGRLFGIVSPLIAQHLYGQSTGGGDGNINNVLYLAGGVTLGCVVTTALLPTKHMESRDERV